MIKKLHIENFQSHKDSTLEFSDGVNVFTGDSDCGKSAIMRSLIWAITNTPGGDAFVSKWCGKKDSCKVTVDAGAEVTRQKGPSFNGYLVDGTKFEALRGAIPDQVTSALNIGPVNIQKQLDGPFMLSNTPGENARLVNELVNLEDIDIATAWVNGEIRDCSSQAKNLECDIADLESKKKDPEAINGLLEAIKRLDTESDRIAALETRRNELSGDMDALASLKVYHTAHLEELVKGAEEKLQKGMALREITDNLRKSITEYESAKDKVIKCDIDLKKIERLSKLVASMEDERQALMDEIKDVERCKGIADAAYAEADALEAQLSKMACPMCGRIGHLGCL